MNIDPEKFEIALSFWPNEIDVSAKRFHESGGMTCANLINAHDAVESQLDERDQDVWHWDWAIFTTLHSLAKNVDILKPKEVPYHDVLKIYIRNKSMS